MKSREGMKEMGKEVAFTEILGLSNEIESAAQKASELAKKLQDSDLSEEQRDAIDKEFREEVSRGFELTKNRVKLLAEYGD